MASGRQWQNIWHGLLEWNEKQVNVNKTKQTREVPCDVSCNIKNGEPELKADGWPSKLIMQLIPKVLIGSIGGVYLKNSKSVLFHPQNCDALESLTKVMSSGFAGCVHFMSSTTSTTCNIKVLILLYYPDKKAYLGFIPNDQIAFVESLRKVIQQQKSMHMPRPTAGPQNMHQDGGHLEQRDAGVQDFMNQLQAERRHNLDKMKQLKQALDVAQQQEHQYKNQLESISNMKTAQLQEALQVAQQQEMHYKMLDQQQMSIQGNQPSKSGSANAGSGWAATA